MKRLVFGIVWFVVIGFAGIIVVSLAAYKLGVTDAQAENLGATLCGPLLCFSSGLATFGTLSGWLPGTKRRRAGAQA